MEKTMTLDINGETRTVPPLPNVMELLVHLGIVRERIAVELNRQIVRRKDWNATPLKDLDKLEIVQFVGGG